MSSVRIRFIALILLCCILTSSYAVGQYISSVVINNYGTINNGGSLGAQFTVTGASGVYTGTENISPYRTTSGSNAATVISTVIGWMSSGQSADFIGDFTISSTVSVSKNVNLNFTQATVTGTTAIFMSITSNVAIIGGHWTGSGTNPKIWWTSGSGESIIDGIDATNFKLEFTSSCNQHITVRNCYFHDPTDITYYLAINNNGYNTLQNCTFANLPVGTGGMYIAEWCPLNLIENCVFDNMGYHSIYLNGYEAAGSGTAIGTNIVRGCTFKNFKNSNMAGIHVKCPYNKIYNNTFEDFTPGWGPVAISCYSDYPAANANDNEIYNNSFSNMWTAIIMGQGISEASQSRNKIYSNTFTNISSQQGCISLNYGAATYETVDTWIYYNTFVSCPTPFPRSDGSYSLIKNTVIAYNTFDTSVPSNEVTFLHGCNNTMIYGNGSQLADYNVPSPLPIPPP